MNLISTIFLLLVIYQVKHLLADYFLQGEYMLGKFKPGWNFLGPLLAHVGVHAAFTWTIAAAFTGNERFSILLALGDGLIHFIMDRIKAGPKYMGRWKGLSGTEYMDAQYQIFRGIWLREQDPRKKIRGNRFFWWALGFDQCVHHLTHYGCIYFILKIRGLI